MFKGTDVAELLKSLKQFMENSTMGEYSARLDILLAFHCHLVNMEASPNRGQFDFMFHDFFLMWNYLWRAYQVHIMVVLFSYQQSPSCWLVYQIFYSRVYFYFKLEIYYQLDIAYFKHCILLICRLLLLNFGIEG